MSRQIATDRVAAVGLVVSSPLAVAAATWQAADGAQHGAPVFALFAVLCAITVETERRHVKRRATATSA